MILNKEIYLETKKDRKGKYGRYLRTIWVKDENGKYFNVNVKLVEDGYAVKVDY